MLHFGAMPHRMLEAAAYLPGGEYWPIVRTTILIAFVLVTLAAILLLYGGNVQNSNIGPVAVRSRGKEDPTSFHAPRTIVTASLETKTIHCTFHLKYVDRRGRPKLVRLGKKRQFKLGALNKRYGWAKADVFGFWNQAHAESLHTAFIESGIPIGPKDDHIFITFPPSDDTLRGLVPEDCEIVGVSQDVWNDIAANHRDALKLKLKRFQKFFQHKRNKKHFEKASPYLDLPDFHQDANLFIRFHFTPNPLFHPDPQVKTTAWLTVLTSLFGLLIQWLYAGF